MLDRVLKNALEGLTVIEEDIGSLNVPLAKQLAGYAAAQGKKVVTYSLIGEDPVGTAEVASARIMEGSHREAISNTDVSVLRWIRILSYLDRLDYDLMVIDSFSQIAFGASEREVGELITQLHMASIRGKSFIVPYEVKTVGERVAAYIRSVADSVIIVRADIAQGAVSRTLYVPKLKGAKPMEKLVKVTVDEERGIQDDTRDFVG